MGALTDAFVGQYDDRTGSRSLEAVQDTAEQTLDGYVLEDLSWTERRALKEMFFDAAENHPDVEREKVYDKKSCRLITLLNGLVFYFAHDLIYFHKHDAEEPMAHQVPYPEGFLESVMVKVEWRSFVSKDAGQKLLALLLENKTL